LRGAGADVEFMESGGSPGLAVGLGGVSLSLLDMTTLFAGIANGGTVRDLRTTPEQPSGPERHLLAADAAWAVTDILADMPPPEGYASRAVTDGRRIAYKTGTSYGFHDAWAVGFDRTHTVGVWIGRPDGAANPGAFGIRTAAPVLHRVFDLLPAPNGDVAGSPPFPTMLAEIRHLPDRLTRFSQSREAVDVRPLELLFPVDGANLVTRNALGNALPVELNVKGGMPPYQWYADQRPIEAPVFEPRTWWAPTSRGQVQVTVFDATGRHQSVDVWIVDVGK
jgi:penicillin-binding protein 1C